MKTEDQIRGLKEHYIELLEDHHLLLAEPFVRNTIEAAYGAIVSTLNWILDEQQTCSDTPKEG